MVGVIGAIVVVVLLVLRYQYLQMLPQLARGDANMVFVIDGDEAEGELVVVASHRTPPPDSRELVATGRYLDRYQRRDGVWRFFRRSLVLDWGDAAPISAASLRPPRPGIEVGRPDRTDPSYLRLPMFARVPE